MIKTWSQRQEDEPLMLTRRAMQDEINELRTELDRLKQLDRNLASVDANSIAAQAEREACAQECNKELEFMASVAQTHPEDSPARDRVYAAARSAQRCADRIRSRAGFQ